MKGQVGGRQAAAHVILQDVTMLKLAGCDANLVALSSRLRACFNDTISVLRLVGLYV
jgi:hypothetical protein